MSQEMPNIEESTKFNFITSIWIVPLIALFIAGWLAYQYYSELGPEIEIVFPKNEGLVSGQSVVKFKNVPIGKVTKIYLKDGVDGVVVSVRMNSKAFIPFLNEYAKFWIVKPEVGIAGVSGLDTLISGTYIEVYSKKGTTFKDEYIGLMQAYRDTSGGEYFVLNTQRGESSIKPGTPVYLKNIKVGKVEHVLWALDNISVDIIVFISKEYAPYVSTDSRFWVRSTFSVDLQNGSLDISAAPAIDFIRGAIEFSTTGKDNNTVPDKHVFELYGNKNLTLKAKVGQGGKHLKQYMLYPKQSIAKLYPNALVRYDGFEVGKVKQIKLNYSKEKHSMRAKVLVEIDTSAFKDENDSMHTGEENFYQAVKEGLRAQFVPSDPITGSLHIDLSFDHADGNKTIIANDMYSILPTVSYNSADIMTKMTKIMDKINNLQLEELLASVKKVVNQTTRPIANADALLLDLRKTAKSLNAMINKKSFATMPDEVNAALREFTHTLRATKKVVKGYDNPMLTKQISQTLRTLHKTSEEMQLFLKMLNRKPNSLIFGDK